MCHPDVQQIYTVDEIVESILDGTCSEEQSVQLFDLGPEAVTLATLAAARQFAALMNQQPHPSTPSGQIPVYTKPNRKKGKTIRGAKPGYQGTHRKVPDRKEEHRCPECANCGDPLQRCKRERKRRIKDIECHSSSRDERLSNPKAKRFKPTEHDRVSVDPLCENRGTTTAT